MPLQNPLLERATVVDRSGVGGDMGAAQSHETEFVRALRPAVIQATAGSKITKVPYEKGYSQMHWVRLTKSGANLSGRPAGSKLRTDITPEEVAEHSTDEDGWTIFRGRVYNLSPYMKYHPGGQAILRKVLGKDCTELFNKYHAWVNAEALLGACQIGTIAVERA